MQPRPSADKENRRPDPETSTTCRKQACRIDRLPEKANSSCRRRPSPRNFPRCRTSQQTNHSIRKTGGSRRFDFAARPPSRGTRTIRFAREPREVPPAGPARASPSRKDFVRQNLPQLNKGCRSWRRHTSGIRSQDRRISIGRQQYVRRGSTHHRFLRPVPASEATPR